MRKLDLLHTYSAEKTKVKKSGVSEHNILKVVNDDDGVSFNNFNCKETTKNHKLNSIFKKDAIHFIYPDSEDVTLKINGVGTKKMICPAHKTTIFSSEQYPNNDFYLQSGKAQKVSVLSIDYLLFGLYKDDSFNDYLDNYYNSSKDEMMSLNISSEDNRIPETVNKILKFWNTSKQDNLLVKAAVVELQHLFIQQYLVLNNQNILSKSEIEKISKLPKIITNQIATKLNIDDIAKQINLRVDRLQLGCEIVFKCNIVALINEIKLQSIANQIFTTKKSLAEIAYENGYTNRGNLYKIFKQRFLCNPMEYLTKSKIIL